MSRLVERENTRRSNAAQRAVAHGEAPDRAERHPETVREKGTDKAAVRDDQHVVTVGMRRGDRLDRAKGALLNGRERLSTWWKMLDRVSDPSGVGVTRPRADLVHRASFPLAERQLTKIVDDGERDADGGHDGTGRQAGAFHGARVNVRESSASEARAERGRLPVTELGERHVLAPLEAPAGVGDRLAVTCEQQRSHDSAGVEALLRVHGDATISRPRGTAPSGGARASSSYRGSRSRRRSAGSRPCRSGQSA